MFRQSQFFLLTVFIFISFLKPVSAVPLECKLLPTLFGIFLKNHYSQKELSEEIRKRTIEQFVRDLDPSKTILLKQDVDTIKNQLGTIFKNFGSGNCAPLDVAYDLLVQRAKENEDFARQFLGENYKIDETVEIVVDPKKRTHAKDSKEKQDFMAKILHFEISNLLIADLKLPEAKKQIVHRYELITKRLKEKKAEEKMENFVEAFAHSLDPHSSFLSRDSMEDFQIQMELSLEGIGAVLRSQDGFTVIESLIKGGGAEKSKQLQPKDKIIAVAQESGKPASVIDMDLRDVVKLIRGKKGTKVRLTVLRQAEETKTFEVTIAREKINIEEQAAKITFENRTVGDKKIKLGFLELPSFYGGGKRGTRSSYADVKKLLQSAKKEKVDGIVLNLSNNGGGLLDEAVNISGLFINKGGVVATKSTSSDKSEVLKDEESGVEYGGPLVVLTSRVSASASEILAGALKDYSRALVVGGDHTFGKGSVQAVIGLPLELGGIKVTTGMFFLPKGKSTQQLGVQSDIVMPSYFNNGDIGEKTLDYSLGPQSISSFLSPEAHLAKASEDWKEIKSNQIKELAQKSQDRVSKSKKFTELKKKIEESKKNEGIIRLADIRKKAKTEKAEEKKKTSQKKKKGEKSESPEEENESPLKEEALNILTDLVQVN
jgi:carboxyl-terminal processing protease